MTRWAFPYHHCVTDQAIIDLTGDSSDSDDDEDYNADLYYSDDDSPV